MRGPDGRPEAEIWKATNIAALERQGRGEFLDIT
jgi:hypothetical protein